MNTVVKRISATGILVVLTVILTVSQAATAAAVAVDSGKPAASPLSERMKTRISIDISAPIQDVIRLLADQANVDHVLSPAVTGEVTVKLTDVPLDEALDNILAANGYGYNTGANIIRVAPIDEIATTQERMIHKVFQITYADVSEVAKALEKLRSKEGVVTFNAGTSHIIVTDTEARVKAISEFIEQVDDVTPQVRVEARIYDITTKDRMDLGIEWQAGRNTTYSPDTTAGMTTVGGNPLGDNQPFSTGVFSGATGKTSGMTGLLRLGWLNSALDIDAVLRAQQNDIDAKLLANPNVLVLDNQLATIKIIQEIPYQELTESAMGGQIGSTSFREVGVELEVTPHITRDEMVRLDLTPKFSIKTDEVVLVGSGNTSFPQPVIDRREATTTLLVKDGQTVVLGGLRQKNVAKVVNKVPLLGDIPVAGWLFKFEGEDVVMSELVVFITPRIVINPVLSDLQERQLNETEFPPAETIKTRFERKLEHRAEEDSE